MRPGGSYVVEGYGPSYGIDDQTLYQLRRGEKITVPGFDAWLALEKRTGFTGPIHQSYPIYWIAVFGPEADAAKAEASRREAWLDFCFQSKVSSQLNRLGGIIMDEFGNYRFIAAPDLGPALDRKGNIVGVEGYWSPRTTYSPDQYPAVAKWLRGDGADDIPSLAAPISHHSSFQGWMEV